MFDRRDLAILCSRYKRMSSLIATTLQHRSILGSKGQGMASNGPFDWTTTSRNPERVGQDWNARIYSRTFRGEAVGRFLSCELTPPLLSTIGIFSSFCPHRFPAATLPSNFSLESESLLYRRRSGEFSRRYAY